MHFAFVAPPFVSHVKALESLAVGLMARGHHATWFHLPDVRRALRHAGVDFSAVGAASHAPGDVESMVTRAARPGGPFGLRRVILDVAAMTDMLCSELPAAFKACGIEAVVADQMEAAGGLVAKALALPFVSVACAVPVNREPRLPLPVMPWGYANDERGLRLNAGSARVYDWLMGPHRRVIERHAKNFGLAPHHHRLEDCLSPHLQLSQLIQDIDFPRAASASDLHHVGPLRDAGRFEALSIPGLDASRPFAFASLGTLQGGRLGLFMRIVKACRAVGIQVLVAHCDRLHADQEILLRQAGAQAVVGFAPQATAIAAAAVVITHGGLNTVMDAVAHGKPQLVLPIAFDQPGMAARVVHAGCGLALPHRTASAAKIGERLRRLLGEPAFRDQARRLSSRVQAAGGVRQAADLIEAALQIRDGASPGSQRDPGLVPH